MTRWASSCSCAATRAGSPAGPATGRHSAEATAAFQLSAHISLSARTAYGSGLPFWPFAGYVNVPRLIPIQGRTKEIKRVPTWGDTQMRYPARFRTDVAARGSFRFRRLGIEPVLSIQNVTAYPNVLYYRLQGGQQERNGPPAELVPQTPFSLPFIPSLGIDVHF